MCVLLTSYRLSEFSFSSDLSRLCLEWLDWSLKIQKCMYYLPKYRILTFKTNLFSNSLGLHVVKKEHKMGQSPLGQLWSGTQSSIAQRIMVLPNYLYLAFDFRCSIPGWGRTGWGSLRRLLSFHPLDARVEQEWSGLLGSNDFEPVTNQHKQYFIKHSPFWI